MRIIPSSMTAGNFSCAPDTEMRSYHVGAYCGHQHTEKVVLVEVGIAAYCFSVGTFRQKVGEEGE